MVSKTMFSGWQDSVPIRCTLLFGNIRSMLNALWQLGIESCCHLGLLLSLIRFDIDHSLMLLFHSRIRVITGLLNDHRDERSCNLLGCYILRVSTFRGFHNVEAF